MRDLLDMSKMSVGASTAELGEDDSDEEGGFQVNLMSYLAQVTSLRIPIRFYRPCETFRGMG